MALKRIEDLKADGWRVEPYDNPTYPFKLVSPDGKKIDVSHSEADAWQYVPNLPGDTVLEACETTQGESVEFFELDDVGGMKDIIRRFGPWSVYEIALTPSDLEALRSDKCIVWGQGEYTTVIFFHDSERGDS